jgi:hypothetical protein
MDSGNVPSGSSSPRFLAGLALGTGKVAPGCMGATEAARAALGGGASDGISRRMPEGLEGGLPARVDSSEVTGRIARRGGGAERLGSRMGAFSLTGLAGRSAAIVGVGRVVGCVGGRVLGLSLSLVDDDFSLSAILVEGSGAGALLATGGSIASEGTGIGGGASVGGVGVGVVAGAAMAADGVACGAAAVGVGS